MKIMYPSRNDTPVRVSNIPVGTVFTGLVGEHRGLFLRIFGGIVLLDNPKVTWPGGYEGEVTRDPEVLDYKVRNIEIHFV